MTEQRENGRFYAVRAQCLLGHETREEAVRCHREVRNARQLDKPKQ